MNQAKWQVSVRERMEVFILPQLDKLRQTGKDRWSACCPAHEDKSPSMQITMGHDDRILMHCFSGCHIDEICSALGLTTADLYPDTTKERYPPLGASQRPSKPNQDSHYIAAFKTQVKRGYKPTAHEREVYTRAVTREASRCHG